MAPKASSGSTRQLAKVVLWQTGLLLSSASNVLDDVPPWQFQPDRQDHAKSERTTTSTPVQINKINLQDSKTSQIPPIEISLDLFGGFGRIVHTRPNLSSLFLFPTHFSQRCQFTTDKPYMLWYSPVFGLNPKS